VCSPALQDIHSPRPLGRQRPRVDARQHVQRAVATLFRSERLTALAIPAISAAVICSLLIKIFADFILLVIFAKRMDRLRYLKAYPLVALFHIPYVVVFAALGQLVRFHWKRSWD